VAIYQTKEDVEAEQRIIRTIEDRFGVSAVSTGVTAGVDVIFIRDGMVSSVAEIKSRKGHYNYEKMLELGSIYVDKKKVRKAVYVAKLLGVDFYFIVELVDKLMYYRLKAEDIDTLRSSTIRLRFMRDQNDIDEVLHFPIIDFEVIQ
jgi:hypothetical protein